MMNELFDLLAEYRETRQKQLDLLTTNQSATCRALIEPVLGLLDWDVHKLEQVVPDFKAPDMPDCRADYALQRAGSQVVALVIAKPLGEWPRRDELARLIAMCRKCSLTCRWGVMTNGERWQLVDVGQEADQVDPAGVSFNLNADTLAAAAAGFIGMAGALAGLSAQPPMEEAAPPEPADEPATTADPPVDLTAYRPLTELDADKDSKHLRLLFPDRKTAEVSAWARLPFHIARWLVNTGRLSVDNCRVPNWRNGRQLLMSPDGLQSFGEKMINPDEVAPGIVMQIAGAARDSVRNGLNLLRRFEVDPQTVRFRAIDQP